MRRMRMNSRYSLRAYAKSLGASPSYLSQLLNSAKPISVERMETFVAEMGYGPEKVQDLLSSTDYVAHQQLHRDIYEVTSIWYYDAILEMTHLESFPGTVEWIAKKIHLSLSETKMAVDTLVRLGLLKIEDGQWIDCFVYSTINFEDAKTDVALKSYQKEILRQSIEAVDQVDPVIRQHRSMIYAVDKNLIPEFHREIRQFILESTQRLEQKSKRKNSLFALQVASFPLIEEASDGSS